MSVVKAGVAAKNEGFKSRRDKMEFLYDLCLLPLRIEMVELN